MGKFDIPKSETLKTTSKSEENPAIASANVNEEIQDLSGQVNEMIEKANAWKVWVEQESTNKENTGSRNCLKIEKQDDGSFVARFSELTVGENPESIKEGGGITTSLRVDEEKEETVWEKNFENIEELKKFLPGLLKDKFPEGALTKETLNNNM